MKKHDENLFLIIALGLVFTGVAVFAVRNQMPSDIISPYLAGWFFENGQMEQIYGYRAHEMFNNSPPAQWLNVVESQGVEAKTLYPYLYPPLWAALMAPVSQVVDIQTFSWFVFAVQIPLMYASIYLAWRLFGQPCQFLYWALPAIFLISVTVIGLSALAENQPHIFVVFLMIFGFERRLAGQKRLAGILLALAACIKIFPVFLMVLLLMRKDFRTSFYMALSGLSLTILSFALAGITLHYLFLEQIRLLVLTTYLGQHNFSFLALFYHLEAALTGATTASIRFGITPDISDWASFTNSVLFVFFLAITALRFGRSESPFLIVAALLLFALVSPFGWSYYYLPLLYFWPAIFLVLRRNRAILATYVVFAPLLSLAQSTLRGEEFYLLAQMSAIFALIAAFIGFLWVGLQKSPLRHSID